MKRFLYLTVCFFILGKFYGCNGDVFVDDFRSSDSELTLDGNGDVATIQFAAANWDWMYVAFDFPIQYNIYDADNRLITTDQGPSLNGLGKIVCTGEMIDFTIERVHPKEVKITVGENALSAPSAAAHDPLFAQLPLFSAVRYILHGSSPLPAWQQSLPHTVSVCFSGRKSPGQSDQPGSFCPRSPPDPFFAQDSFFP